MRLDEYQRWLDSQFVEERDSAASPEVPQDAAAEHLVAAVGPPPAPAAPLRTEPAATGAVSGPSAAGARSFGSLEGLSDDLDVPGIERFLPHLAAPAGLSEGGDAGLRSVAPPEATGEPDATALVPDAAAAVDDEAPGAVAVESQMVEGVVEAEAQMVEGAVADSHVVEASASGLAAVGAAPPAEATVDADAGALEVEHPAAGLGVASLDEHPAAGLGVASLDEEPSASAQTPQSPARRRLRARNVRASDAVKELDPSELWQLAPQHLQRLIAAGDDGEVAQNSYSRRFKETRLELIQRLLDPTLSLEDTARLLNVCPATVRRYTNRGLLTHQRTQGDQRRFRLSDVLAFLEAQARSSG